MALGAWSCMVCYGRGGPLYKSLKLFSLPFMLGVRQHFVVMFIFGNREVIASVPWKCGVIVMYFFLEDWSSAMI